MNEKWFSLEIEEGRDDVKHIDAVCDGSSIVLEKYDPAIPQGMEKFEEEMEDLSDKMEDAIDEFCEAAEDAGVDEDDLEELMEDFDM